MNAKTAVVAACALFFCFAVRADDEKRLDFSVKFTGDVASSYVDKNCLSAEPKLLYRGRKLSAVASATGDLFLFHTDQRDGPYLFKGLVDRTASPDRSGIYNIEYDKYGNAYIRCEFIGRWNGHYTMIVDVEFTQKGEDIYARVTGTHYPYDDGYKVIAKTRYYDFDVGGYGGVRYYEGLDWNVIPDMARASVHNVELTFIHADFSFEVK